VLDAQQTIEREAVISGRGLFSGDPAKLVFKPAPANHGVVFVRVDGERTEIPARIEYVALEPRRTTLKNGKAKISTCEHCLSAVAAAGLDNLIIEVDGPEVPGLDGSALPFYETILEAGRVSLDAQRNRCVVRDPIVVQDGDSIVSALPSDDDHMQVLFDLDYGEDSFIGRQLHSFSLGSGSYAKEIAPARTYVLEAEARALRAAGMGKHLTPDELLVFTSNGPMGGNSLRFKDEPVRHKILDLIGDLFLLGAPIQGRIIAHKSSHALNHALVRKLIAQLEQQKRQLSAATAPALDIRQLSRVLPHRYPMLLVDRVLEIRGDQMARGVKNVTINEPFFQGHYPGTPIMPGVLIVEAMSQLSGVLIGQKLEHTGKLAVLLSLDRVKLRKPVTPGDQLILEAETIRIRSRIAHMKCRAYVGSELAAEAEVKFMLVDDEQE